MIEPYERRPVRSLGVWETDGWRLKAYLIARPGESPAAELISAARERSREVVALPCRHETYGVGFVGVHQGHGYNQVFVDRWANHNELLHDTFVSDGEAPGDLQPAPRGHNSVCVWDLALQAFEREAWVARAMGPAGDLDAYLYAVLNGEV